MIKIFKYYIKQWKKIQRFKYWSLSEKAIFIGISNLLYFCVVCLFPTAEIIYLSYLLFFLYSVIYLAFLVIKIILNKYKNSFYNSNQLNALIKDIDSMSGIQFETVLSHLFRSEGYDVKLTPKSGDYGADLVLRKGSDVIVVQAKRYSDYIGISAVNEIIGASGYNKANKKWVITNQFYTNAAIVQAHKNKVKLLDRDDLILMLRNYNKNSDKRKPILKDISK
ncbi:restriction endonuclease [Halobacillus litoralis]|uniref:restriction endonuclease n=1 Tax=Halobacillus litoralis TaxID=45668 RepID=UPI0024934847|nr:restriction endonuclease [Halobacillus litoralis]